MDLGDGSHSGPDENLMNTLRVHQGKTHNSPETLKHQKFQNKPNMKFDSRHNYSFNLTKKFDKSTNLVNPKLNPN